MEGLRAGPDAYDEVELIRNTWFDTYPAIKPYQREQYSHRYDAVWSVAGRPRRACWKPEDENGERALWYTDCCNFAVQASASDLLLDAMARVDRALPGTLVASVHDELLLEVDEDRGRARRSHHGRADAGRLRAVVPRCADHRRGQRQDRQQLGRSEMTRPKTAPCPGAAEITAAAQVRQELEWIDTADEGLPGRALPDQDRSYDNFWAVAEPGQLRQVPRRRHRRL